MKLFILLPIIMFFGCFQDYDVKQTTHEFDELQVQDFNWKSHQDFILEFRIPDNDLRKVISVEVYTIDQSGNEVKTNSKFVEPNDVLLDKLLLANHIHKVKVSITQGKRHRTKTIDRDMIESVNTIYLDESLAKGDLE